MDYVVRHIKPKGSICLLYKQKDLKDDGKMNMMPDPEIFSTTVCIYSLSQFDMKVKITTSEQHESVYFIIFKLTSSQQLNIYI